MTTKQPSTRQFVLVAQATSGVTLGATEVEVNQVPANGKLFSVRIGTRQQKLAGSGPPIPTGLQATIVGTSGSIEDMLENGIVAVNQVAPFLAFLGNSAVDDFMPEVAWDASPDLLEREYFQLFIPATLPSLVRPRPISADDVLAIISMTLRHPRSDRIRRAIGQYYRALENWQPGSETIAVTSLWTAAEILTPLVRSRVQNRWNCGSPADLATSLGLDLKVLDSEIRRLSIIGPDLYSDAKSASDGFEHGFLDFARVMEKAAPIRDALARRIRQVILDEINLGSSGRSKLRATPYDRPGCTVEHKTVRARIVDPKGRYAVPPKLRPYLRWEEKWTGARASEDGPTTLRRQDTFLPELDPSAKMKDIRVQIMAGQEGYVHDPPAGDPDGSTQESTTV